MKSRTRLALRRAVCSVVAVAMLAEPIAASAALLQLVRSPLFVTPPIPPLVMLDISKDQQLYKKAYNDYSDLDGDGVIETTYKHAIDYYGYFDSFKCYAVGSTAAEPLEHFYPAAWTADKYCNGNQWSGNFLNWVTMTRMDAVRKLLFGGQRRRDFSGTSGYLSTTVLERVSIPTDAHAWAKYYNRSDINRLTPFNPSTSVQFSGNFTMAVGIPRNSVGSVTFTNVPAAFVVSLSYGDQIGAETNVAGVPVRTIIGRVTDKTASTVTIFVDQGAGFNVMDTISLPANIPQRECTYAGGVGTALTGPPAPTDCPTAAPDLGTPIPNSGPVRTNWNLANLSSPGITFCNSTPGDGGGNRYSHTTTYTPRVKVVAGNYELWAANERFQCGWYDGTSGLGNNTFDIGVDPSQRNLQGGFLPGNQQASSNGNQAGASGLNGSAENPSKFGAPIINGAGSFATPVKALGPGTNGPGEYRVLVDVCNVNFITPPPGQRTNEKCRQYIDSSSGTDVITYKPYGLLQTYGEGVIPRIRFGLITGSYSKNTNGGVLRKNVGGLSGLNNSSDEIRANGTFNTTPAAGVGSIIQTLSALRMYGYDYTTGTYIGADNNCTYQLTSADLTDNKCRTWGNPMSEIYAESLRYFAGATAPTAAYDTNADASLIPGVTRATWPATSTAVLSNANYCAPLNILVFNASVSSKDSDLTADPFNGAIGGGGNVGKAFTDRVGTAEGVATGTSYFVGSNGVTNNGLCDAKPFSAGATLGSAQGICPEAPTLNGSYLMAGLAYAARTNRIRTDLNQVPATDKKSLKVNTYGIALATNVPRIEVAVPGSSTGQKIIIQPSYRLVTPSGAIGSGAIVDVKVVSQTVTPTLTTGRLYVNWEDSEQGGDYDQDVWGVIDYRVTATTVTVTTDVVAASTANGQGFGYIISGTDKDGPHFHSGIYNFSYTDPSTIPITNSLGVANNVAGQNINLSGGCQSCVASDKPSTATYTVASSGAANILKDPLFYAAKYGGFNESGNNPPGQELPDLAIEWDNFNNTTGALGSDGLPDNFFFVSNPLGLETALDRVFLAILQTASASAVATNSSRLNSTTRVYQAVFNPAEWSGRLLAFSVNAATGVPATAPDWDAGQVSLNPTSISPSGRKIITYNKGGSGVPQGIPFAWPADPANPTASELSLAQVTALRTNPNTNVVEAASEGLKRLNYLRGDASNEGAGTTSYRARPSTKLGDIINSNPALVGPPSTGYSDPTYRSFVQTRASRQPVIYIGANDGMLHAFDASTSGTQGSELLAYVPSPVYRNLSKLTSRTYSHDYYVDGSPVVEDVKIAGAWYSYLVGTLNRGGQGIYALDVTDPGTFNVGSAASLVKWEFTDADDPDLGFTFGTPLIRRMNDGTADGRFMAIVSGGYNNSQLSTDDPAEITCTTSVPRVPANCTTSTTGKGVMFILDVRGPSNPVAGWQLGVDYYKLETTNGTPATPNGLASPLAIDVNTDGKVDYIYSGDLEGNMWKFDVTGGNPATWSSIGSRTLLFTARDSGGSIQPITSAADAVQHPSGTGIMLSFGTGKYLENIDITPPSPGTPGTPYIPTQTIYGIWDRPEAVVTVPKVSRSQLMEQLLQPGVTNIITNPDLSVSRITTRHQPNYADLGSRNDSNSYDGMGAANPDLAALVNAKGQLSTTPAAQRGWFLNLFNGSPAAAPTGERVVFAPFVRNGIVLYSSLWPTSNSCLGLTSGDNIALNISTGARPDLSVFNLNGDSTVNASDLVNVGTAANPVLIAVSSRRIEGGAAQPPTLVAMPSASVGGGEQFVGYQSPSGGQLTYGYFFFGRGPGRVSWREILY